MRRKEEGDEEEGKFVTCIYTVSELKRLMKRL